MGTSGLASVSRAAAIACSNFRACDFAIRYCRPFVITVHDYAVVLPTELGAMGLSFSSSLLMLCSNVGQ